MAARRDAMFRGEKINITESRAVLHVALRAPRGAVIEVDGQNVVPDVHAVLDRMATSPARVRDGEWTGHTGKRIRNVVNIGIGGSYLGPEMAYRGAAPLQRPRPDASVSSPTSMAPTFTEATQDLDAAETLFIVSSKTFTTLETMTNAATARAWLVGKLGDRSRGRQALRRRVDQRRRRSRSSASTPPTCSGSGTGSVAATRWTRAIGLSTMIAIGPDNFRAMLAGFHAMDEHFRTAPLEQEPAGAAGAADRLVQQFLRRRDDRQSCRTRSIWRAFPPICSNCRWRATASTWTSRARRVDYQTGPIIWGEPGTDGQHSFYQLHPPGHEAGPLRLHRLLPAAEPACGPARLLMANLFAQAEALAFGKTAEELAAEGIAGLPDAVPRHRGQPADQHDPGRATRSAHAGSAGGALRAQRVHAGRDLGDRLVRPMGRGAGQGAGQDASSPNCETRGRAASWRTTARPTRSSGATARIARGAERNIMRGPGSRRTRNRR